MLRMQSKLGLKMFTISLRVSVRKYIKLGTHRRMYAELSCNSSNINNHINAKNKPYTQTQHNLTMQQTRPFEELVFYPNGHRPLSSSSTNEIDVAYEAAVKQLNLLQSNIQSINQSVANRSFDTVADTVKYLERSGLPLCVVEQMSFIHIAGTKGKGSTCALTESILRHFNVRTGFFSSPHILSTNERFRINGQPLAKHKFVHHFWHCYNRLMAQREHALDMPNFFKFCTIMGLHIFFDEKVDVVVLEVGIGGENDCTNLVRNVSTVGITSLGLEHTELLGNSLRMIAWQKAGIIKPNCHVYTHVWQTEALEVLRTRAMENNAILCEVLPTEAYFREKCFDDYNFNSIVLLNGSLAIQLAYDWLRKTRGPLQRSFAVNEALLSDEALDGLRNCHWPGRCQHIEYMGMNLYLDGAHTMESMKVCTDWFLERIKDSKNPKIMFFNRTGRSDTTYLLQHLHKAYPFDLVCFTPNVASPIVDQSNQVIMRVDAERQMMRAEGIRDIWEKICIEAETTNNARVFATVYDAFVATRSRYDSQPIDVLVTGSIHLLGAVVAALTDFEKNTHN